MPKYVECALDSIPPDIRFTVPRALQGQIVEHAYGHSGRDEGAFGDPYRRITDRSDGTVTYYRLATTTI